MGDGTAEGSSAIGDGGQAAVALTPDADGMHGHVFESLQLEGSYVGDLLYNLAGIGSWGGLVNAKRRYTMYKRGKRKPKDGENFLCLKFFLSSHKM